MNLIENITKTENITETEDTAKTKNIAKGNFVANLAVKTKIFLGFIAVLLVTAVVAVFGYTSLATVGQEVEEYARDINEAETAAKIESRFFELEIYVREFAVTGNEEDFKLAQKVAAKLKTDLAAANAKFKDPAELEKLKIIGKDFGIYMKDFGKVVKLEHEFKNLIDEVLDPTSKKFAADLVPLHRDYDVLV